MWQSLSHNLLFVQSWFRFSSMILRWNTRDFGKWIPQFSYWEFCLTRNFRDSQISNHRILKKLSFELAMSLRISIAARFVYICHHLLLSCWLSSPSYSLNTLTLSSPLSPPSLASANANDRRGFSEKHSLFNLIFAGSFTSQSACYKAAVHNCQNC